MEQNLYHNLKIKHIILSRGRADSITTHDLIHYDHVVVPECDFKEYAMVIPLKKLVKIPSELEGLSLVRNWVLRNFDDIVIMYDDDIRNFVSLTRENPFRIYDKDMIKIIVENTAQCAVDVGANVFGFNQLWDVRKFNSIQPFDVSNWIGCVMGVVGRDIWFDDNNKLRVDVDFCLQNLLEKRIVWMDKRFSFAQERFTNLGGNSLFRTKTQDQAELHYLKNKWGKHLKVKANKGNISLWVMVKR